jgi:hypothetical protein
VRISSCRSARTDWLILATHNFSAGGDTAGIISPKLRKNIMEKKSVNLLVMTLVCAMALTIAQQSAWGQNPNAAFHDAGAKIRGDMYWPERASSHQTYSARNYAHEFHNYVVKTPTPDRSIVKEANVELGRYLTEISKHLATMKKDFAPDKDASATIASLEKELEAAVAQNQVMADCCQNEPYDKVAAMTCCSDLVKQLDKIKTEHAALMRKLVQKYGAAPAKK